MQKYLIYHYVIRPGQVRGRLIYFFLADAGTDTYDIVRIIGKKFEIIRSISEF